ncbi:hypothetical protein P8C59_000564 [Phyllachora maydis]|uniref:Uncharacterized protein n=1 Tax=Phyllachora maydis TaxID=1825666 RepID=A0AAD9HWM0_9PEZI|nr:hypothetical protein P8C59_000564 [Phyllachora maydis]
MYASVKTLAAVLLLSSVASAHILGMGYVLDRRDPDTPDSPKSEEPRKLLEKVAVRPERDLVTLDTVKARMPTKRTYWRYLFGMDKREPESMAVPKEILQARHTIEAGVLKDLGSRSEPGPDHVSGSRAVFGF